MSEGLRSKRCTRVWGVLEGHQREGGWEGSRGSLEEGEPCLWPALALGEPGVVGWGGSRTWSLSRVLSGTGQGTVCLAFFL